MTGTYLRDTFDQILMWLNDLNAALSAQGLEELTEINDLYVSKVNKVPYMLIDLTSRKQDRVSNQCVQIEENVPVEFKIFMRGNQRDAILYEGIVKAFIKSKENEITSQITDAQLVVIHPSSSEMRTTSERKNADGFEITIRYEFKYSWQ